MKVLTALVIIWYAEPTPRIAGSALFKDPPILLALFDSDVIAPFSSAHPRSNPFLFILTTRVITSSTQSASLHVV